MKYIKLFEQHYTPEDEFIRSKIDWKLFDYIKDILTKYSDEGYKTTLTVSIETNASYGVYAYYSKNNYETKDQDTEAFIDYDPKIIRNVMDDYEITLTYQMFISQNYTTLNREEWIKILDKVQRKFNIPEENICSYPYKIKQKVKV